MKKVFLKCRQTVGFIIMLTLLSNQIVFGQIIPKILQLDNEEIRSKTERVDPAGWLYFNQTADVLPGELFTRYKSATGLKSNDEMQIKKEWTDKYGWSHVRFQQYYKGLKVEGGEWSEHWKDCFTEIAHGKLIEDLNINENPTITEVQAIQIAMQEIGASEYAWQNEDWEDAIKEDLDDPNATYYPDAELLIGHVLGAEFIKSNYRLSWKFKVRATNPSSFDEVYIDAHSGDILSIKSVLENNGPSSLLFGYGEHTIDTKPKLWYHILKANDSGRNIHTKYGSGLNGDNFWWTSNITDGDDDWGTDEQMGTTAHWVVSESWDYFEDVHGRNGYDNNGEEVRIWANSTLQNAVRFRDNDREYIEFGSIGTNYLATIDIAGHEFTHGITANLSDLGGANEPGALNESFSDIFGVLVERNAEGILNDWTVGEDSPIWLNGGTNIRSLSNPGAFPSFPLPDRGAIGLPDTYQGPRWYGGVWDDGGEHINCGVQNRWFHLLSTGGNHNGVNIQPIGIDNSAEITYFNLSTFMQNGSQYADARQGAINAARIIFGICSFEEIQTTNAWSACGVGPLFTGPCLELHGPEFICVDLFYTTYFRAYDVPGSIYFWDFPEQWTAHVVNGNGTSRLVVTDIGNYDPYWLPITETVTVTSSSGGTESIQVVLEDCFDDPDDPRDPCDKYLKLVIYENQKDHNDKHSNPSLTTLSSIEEDINQVQLRIFPNPSKDILNLWIDSGFKRTTNVAITNVFGQIVKEWELHSNHDKIDISDLQDGLYTISVKYSGNNLSRTFMRIPAKLTPQFRNKLTP